MTAQHLNGALTALVQAWKTARPVDGKLPVGNAEVVADWWDVVNDLLKQQAGV